jgi:serine/threonine protein phosphatase 1
MISRLFAKRSTTSASRISRTPPGCVVWAVGDIHGRADLADRLIQAIRADLYASDAERKVIVFLGDHIDRGPDSRGVLDQLCNLSADPKLEVHCLRGNHEDRMEAFLVDPAVGPGWCEYGGRDTLSAYGVSPPAMRGDMEGWAETAKALAKALPRSHRQLLDGQAWSVTIGDYFFCHAGARPGVPLEQQAPEDLMWIRQPFLDHPKPFEKVVVHGHTPTEAVVSDGRRLSLDTGAYATNVLSAVRLGGETRVLLQARGRGDQISVEPRALAA